MPSNDRNALEAELRRLEKQVEELMNWLKQMAEQIPGSDGLTDAQRAEQLKAKNEAVLAV